jgi:hypothetical protein
MCNLVNLLLKLNIYVFSSKFKEFKNSENDISWFLFLIFKDWKTNWLVYGGIVVKMDNSNLFEMVLKIVFHAWAEMDNEIYSHVRMCWCCYAFYNGFDNNDTTQEIYVCTNHSIFSFVCTPYIGTFLFHKSPWSSSLPWFWNSMTK